MTTDNRCADGPVIDVRGLRKDYGARAAVRDVSFTVARGEVFCLLGPNGAGKTSITEILAGYRSASGGEATVLDIPVGGSGAAPRRLRERIGIVLQSCGLQEDLTVIELLTMYGRYHAHPRPVSEVLELVELGDRRDARAGRLSGGERRRLDVALALVGDPELIFLDEPTTGFDPAARRHAWSAIRSLCDLGKTVFLTTHFMDEAQHLADRVAVMRAGEIVAAGTPEQLGGRDRRPAEIRFSLPEGLGVQALPDVAGESRIVARARGGKPGDDVLVLTRDPLRASHALTGWALDRGVALTGFTVAQPTLEDIYLALTADATSSASSASSAEVRA